MKRTVLSTDRIICELGRICADYEDYAEHKADVQIITDAANRLRKLSEMCIEARRVAEQLRNDAERPGGGRRVLPWEKK